MDTKHKKASGRVPPERVVKTIAITPHASESLDDFCKRTGVPKTQVVSRVLEWFSTLNTTNQLGVILHPELVGITTQLEPTEKTGQSD